MSLDNKIQVNTDKLLNVNLKKLTFFCLYVFVLLMNLATWRNISYIHEKVLLHARRRGATDFLE